MNMHGLYKGYFVLLLLLCAATMHEMQRSSPSYVCRYAAVGTLSKRRQSINHHF